MPMLTVRNEQMRILHAERMVPVLYQRLQEMGALRMARIRQGLEPLPTDSMLSLPEERDFNKRIRHTIREDVYRALAQGILSEDGLLQYVSFRFTLGRDDWFAQPEVRAVLERSGMTEVDRLQEIYDL